MSREIPAEDSQLIERLRDPRQCRAAFGEVIRAYSEPLYWQIRRMVENHDDANDLLQNTFMKAWQSLENFRGDAKLTTWRQNVSLDDEESGLLKGIEADGYVDGDKLAGQLREAVASLPEKQRLVFNMKYYDEMKYEQMSEILGTSVGALKASYHLAVKKIGQYIEDHN